MVKAVRPATPGSIDEPHGPSPLRSAVADLKVCATYGSVSSDSFSSLRITRITPGSAATSPSHRVA